MEIEALRKKIKEQEEDIKFLRKELSNTLKLFIDLQEHLMEKK